MNHLFIKLFSSYVIAMIFFIGLLPRIIVNSVNSDKTESNKNPLSYSYVLLNS